jgi:hypothetical protein
LCVTTRYGIDTNNSKCSSSPLYTGPNSPSSSTLLPPIMDKNPTQIPSDADDHVSRLESGLLQAQEHARVQQNTLDHILQLLQCLPSMGNAQTPQNIPAAPESQPLVTPADPTPPVRARGLKPVTLNDFDGDCLKGRVFLNSCWLYISLCKD